MFFFHKSRFKKLVNMKEAEERFKEVKPELEKNDPLAMAIAALIVFLPIVLLLVGLLFVASYLLGRG